MPEDIHATVFKIANAEELNIHSKRNGYYYGGIVIIMEYYEVIRNNTIDLNVRAGNNRTYCWAPEQPEGCYGIVQSICVNCVCVCVFRHLAKCLEMWLPLIEWQGGVGG